MLAIKMCAHLPRCAYLHGILRCIYGKKDEKTSHKQPLFGLYDEEKDSQIIKARSVITQAQTERRTIDE